MQNRRINQTGNVSYDALEVLGEAILVLTRAGIVAWANTASGRLLNQPTENLTASDFNSFLVKTSAEFDIRQILSRADSEQEPDLLSLHLRLPNKKRLIVECLVRRCPESFGEQVYLLSMRDVTEQRAREDKLKLSAKVFEFSGEAIMITDEEDRILSVNAAFTEVTGYPAEEVVGKKPLFLDAGRADDSFFEKLWDTVHREGHWKGEVWNRRKRGDIYPEWLAISAVRNDRGDVDHYISIFSDITERKAKEEHIRHQAEHDFLTGLPNRVLLEDRFERLVANGQRHPQQIALLFIDLDGFKEINDAQGHRVGDTILTVIAQRILGSVRATDTVSRHGGDEFVCLLTDFTSTMAIKKIAETILRTVQQPVTIGDHEISVSASIGISLSPDHGSTLGSLISCADAAMYEVKRNGRNGLKLFQD